MNNQKTKSENARLSIIMPVYNSERYLRQAIESILAQTYTDFEFIIINDRSTDSSLEIIQSYAKADERIRVISHTQNLGPAKASNLGITHARGELIAHMDDDDVSLPDRFETQVHFLDENPAVDILGSWVDIIDKNNQPTGKNWNPLSSSMILRWTTFFRSPVAHSAVMMRRKIIDFGWRYNESNYVAVDYDLWANLNLNFLFSNIQRPLVQYRVHESSISSTNKAYQDKVIYDISKTIISSYLGKNIPLEIVRLFRNPTYVQSLTTCKTSIRILQELYKKFCKDNYLDSQDSVFIKLDIANKMSQISYRINQFYASKLLRLHAISLVFITLIFDIVKNNHREVSKIIDAKIGTIHQTPWRNISR